MIKKNTFCLLLFSLLISGSIFSQDISLYTQINGRYDFTFVGNTLNTEENSFMLAPTILTSSSADLNLGPNDVIERAYLYWAGCGTGDFEVQLNGVDITPDRTFSIIQTSTGLPHFSAFKDVTAQIQATGNGTYTMSELDLTAEIPTYFYNKTNFGGWAIIVVFQNDALPLNQLNIYDGMQAVPDRIDISLSSLNVIDNFDAKIGFLAWEGDVGIANNESLTINGNLLSNPPLNPSNNAFNSTNSITSSSELYNMDLDVYTIQNNIHIGDTTADISLTSDQDYVMINAIVTKLNSQLPDATIVLNNYTNECNTGIVEINYTVYNINSTEILPANTPITFYVGNTALGTFYTQNNIPIGGNENGLVSLNIPSSITSNFILIAVVDDAGTGTGIVTELVETNNTFEALIELKELPAFNPLEDLLSCNLGLTRGIFNFSNYEDLVKTDPLQIVSFYENNADATLNTNEIINTTNYEAITTPKEIFIRIENEFCYNITSFYLKTRNCPPEVFNAVSANNDGLNDGFFIEGLRDIFVNFKLEIYNRWGRLIWTGNNNIPDWDGKVAQSVGSENAPEGTYYYILYLNDPDYNEPLTGYLYLTR